MRPAMVSCATMRHHYVPQFLLRAWAETQPDRKVESFRLDLPHLPSSRRAPKHVGYEENLFALTMPVVAGMEQQAVERHLLRRIDDLAADVLRKLAATGLAGLTPDNRRDWVRFLMSLRLRQPNIIQLLRIESSEHLETSLTDKPEEYDALAAMDDPPTLVEWGSKELLRPHRKLWHVVLSQAGRQSGGWRENSAHEVVAVGFFG